MSGKKEGWQTFQPKLSNIFTFPTESELKILQTKFEQRFQLIKIIANGLIPR